MTPELPAFPCPHCSDRAFVKRSVANDAPPSAGLVLTHLHACASCGENYLSTVHVAPDRTRTETWDYYLEREVSLRRVRRYAPSGAYELSELAPLFLIGGAAASEEAWRAALAEARCAPSPLLDTERVPASTVAEHWLRWWSAVSRRPVFQPLPLRLVEQSLPEVHVRRSA